LGDLRNPFSIRHIRAVVKESNVDVRRSAAQALGKIGGEESLPLLVGLVKDKNHYVKISAEEALRKVSDLKFC
jgi:HEAT repeat protein